MDYDVPDVVMILCSNLLQVSICSTVLLHVADMEKHIMVSGMLTSYRRKRNTVVIFTMSTMVVVLELQG